MAALRQHDIEIGDKVILPYRITVGDKVIAEPGTVVEVTDYRLRSLTCIIVAVPGYGDMTIHYSNVERLTDAR